MLLLVTLALPSSAAAKEWFDYYREGIAAARNNNWSTVIERMNQALKLKEREEAQARTYGNVFVRYRPYYYRGIAHLSMGNTAAGVADLERTGGPGELNLGAVDTLLLQARQTLQAQMREREREEAPRPAPVQQPVEQAPPRTQTVPAQDPPPVAAPAVPAVNPAIAVARKRAEGLITRANTAAQEARRQQAPSLAADQYQSGERLLLQASAAQASAESVTDWTRVGDLADRAQRTLRASITAASVAANASRTLPSRTTDEVLSPTRSQLRLALENYFGGRFAEAASTLDQLARTDGGNNAMVWAFLGAARYYDYYLEGERNASKRDASVNAFRRARSLDPSLELSSRYFSPRVQRFYQSVVE